MKILIPSFLSDNPNIRNHRKSIRHKQLELLKKFNLLRHTVIAYSNYLEEDFYADSDLTYIESEIGLYNALNSLLEFAKKCNDQYFLFLDDDIHFNENLSKVLSHFIRGDIDFDVISLHEFDSLKSDVLHFRETYDLCNSAMLIKGSEFPEFEDSKLPSLRWGIQLQKENKICYRIKDCDFLFNQCTDISNINPNFFNKRQYVMHLIKEDLKEEFGIENDITILKERNFEIDLDLI